jgi:hypothetical protein
MCESVDGLTVVLVLESVIDPVLWLLYRYWLPSSNRLYGYR